MIIADKSGEQPKGRALRGENPILQPEVDTCSSWNPDTMLTCRAAQPPDPSVLGADLA